MVNVRELYRVYRAVQKKNFKRLMYAHLRSSIGMYWGVADAYRDVLIRDTGYGANIERSRIEKILDADDECRIRREKKFVIPGEWDLRAVPIVDNIYDRSFVYRTIRAIFKDKQPYPYSEEYQKKLEEIRANGKAGRGIVTRSQLDRYFDKLESIFVEIEENGYLERKDKTLAERLKYDEIGVLIGRHGELIRPCNFGGSHRFAIATILDIRVIPVRILGVHPDFLNARARETSLRRLKNLVCLQRGYLKVVVRKVDNHNWTPIVQV